MSKKLSIHCAKRQINVNKICTKCYPSFESCYFFSFLFIFVHFMPPALVQLATSAYIYIEETRFLARNPYYPNPVFACLELCGGTVFLFWDFLYHHSCFSHALWWYCFPVLGLFIPPFLLLSCFVMVLFSCFRTFYTTLWSIDRFAQYLFTLIQPIASYFSLFFLYIAYSTISSSSILSAAY